MIHRTSSLQPISTRSVISDLLKAARDATQLRGVAHFSAESPTDREIRDLPLSQQLCHFCAQYNTPNYLAKVPIYRSH